MTKPSDDNDRAQAGTMPDDPEDDAEPMTPPGGKPEAAEISRPLKLAEMLDGAVRRMAARADGSEKPIPLPWPKVEDALSGGLRQGLHILVGNTGTGKTQWVLQAAIHAAQAGTPVLYIALEADDIEFVARCYGLASGKKWSPLALGTPRDDLSDVEGKDPRKAVRDDHLKVLNKHTDELKDLPLEVLLAPPLGWNYGDLEVLAKELRQTYQEPEYGTLLIVLDYLQIIGDDKSPKDLRERIGQAAYVCKHTARLHNAAVLVASSTARDNYLKLSGEQRDSKGGVTKARIDLGRGNPSRFVGTGKESGEIEFSADTMMALTQERWGGNEPPPGGTVCHLALAKVRAGKPGWVELRFNGSEFSEPVSGSWDV